MAVTETPRHQLKKYGAGTDPHPNRGTFNAEVDKLEALPALKQGSAGSRPAAGVGKVLYWDESTKRLHLDDGTTWQEVAPIGGGGAGRNITAGGAGSEGTSVRAARADHTHVIAIATAALDGAMSKTDKAKLDAATASNVPSTIVYRNADGNFSVAPPTSGTHASTKAYVDAVVWPLALRDPILLLAGENLDTKVVTNPYHNNLNTNATAELNYPVALAGLLLVNATGAFIYQTYHTYGSSNRRFHRSRYQGVWSVWKETTVGRATQTVDGLLSFQDKTKLDTATFYATADTLMKRTADGRTQINTPIYAADAATKGYVDKQTAAGQVNINITQVGTPASATVTFPSGRFAAAPGISVTPYSTHSAMLGPLAITSVSATGFTVWGARSVIGALTISWIAVA